MFGTADLKRGGEGSDGTLVEAKGEASARLIEHLKKGDMAREAIEPAGRASRTRAR